MRHWDLSQVSFLLIEDNLHMRSIVRSILAGFGVRQIYEANDGADGLETLIDRTPDFVLCDWMMSPVSGGEFLKIMRRDRDPHISTTPVLVVSAHSRKTVILEAMRVGIHGFVAKPVAPVVLYKRICGVLERQLVHGRTKGLFREKFAQGTAETDPMLMGSGTRLARDARPDMLSTALL
ncbi:response regulator [Roseibium suaedae]|uniref:Response regulator receiver domain-containing protein n=1 Tax=Roseibium suaedae TaxID=735517 RepID=A0A1M7LPE1_9HYPH|nr:response regulator [Roseibium suaedae]SHM79892.1 Response regulator receiver domain-containing protein [Roseibium suaedae]